MPDLLKQITKWTPGKRVLVMNFEKYKELAKDHSAVLSGKLRKGQLSSSEGCSSESPSTEQQ